MARHAVADRRTAGVPAAACRDPAAGDAKRAQAQYGQAWAAAEEQAYYAALKTRYKAEVLAKPGETVVPAAN